MTMLQMMKVQTTYIAGSAIPTWLRRMRLLKITKNIHCLIMILFLSQKLALISI